MFYPKRPGLLRDPMGSDDSDDGSFKNVGEESSDS